MNRQAKLTAFFVASVVSGIAVVTSTMSVASIRSFAAADSEIWYHYAKVNPTEESHGSKEFWAKANENCSLTYFEAPGSEATVLDRDFSKNDCFAQLERDDARYIPSLYEQRRFAISPTLSSDGKTVTYGLYPQTNVKDAKVLAALNAIAAPESNGYYLYQDTYYAKIDANPYPYGSNYAFSNGITIVGGVTYWFECEPITWKVLAETDGSYYILSSLVLDARRYGENTNIIIDYDKEIYGDGNNYSRSEIRAWLNEDFLSSAFAFDCSAILTTNVDNSASTTDTSLNSHACEDTQDKVFLPSYKDYVNYDYGFGPLGKSSRRTAKATDWARAGGVQYKTSAPYGGCYWTRSPYKDSSDKAYYVDDEGDLTIRFDLSNVSYQNMGVRPALRIVIA